MATSPTPLPIPSKPFRKPGPKPPHVDEDAPTLIRRAPDVIDVDQVALILGIARKSVYEGAARGEIPHRRVGRRLIFSRRALLDWLSCKAASSGKDE